MGALRALLAHISVSLLTRESPCFPRVTRRGWEQELLPSSREASPRTPGALGWEGSSQNLRPPGKLFFPDGLALTCDPSSQLRTVLAQRSPGLRKDTLPGPKLQQPWLQLPEGRMGSLQGPRPCPGFSRHTSVAFQRSLGHRRAKEQRAEEENGEKQDQGPGGKRQWWGKGAGETYRAIFSPSTDSWTGGNKSSY